MLEITTQLLLLLMNGLLGYAIWVAKRLTKTRGNTARGIMLLLRRELVEMYETLQNMDTLSESEFREFSETYDCYHALGGNGVGTHMYEKISKKEIKK